MLVYLHIVTGALSLISGAISFSSRKGGFLHKKAGIVFVINMMLMTSSGSMLAILNLEKLNAIAGCVTLYLVGTAFLTVSRAGKNGRFYSLFFMVFGFVVGSYGIVLGVALLNDGIESIDGNPTQALIIFGVIALAASIFDIRFVINSHLGRNRRLVRHIWRIGTAMLIATASFFLGQSQVIPEQLRVLPVLLGPVLLVLVLTIFWAMRVQFWGLKNQT